MARCISSPTGESSTCVHSDSKSAAPRFRLISKKPIVAGAAELAANPRSRSAKLRVAERLGEAA